MRTLNRPMFKMGGPVKEGIMHGIREPKNMGGRMLLVGQHPKQFRDAGGREQHWAPLITGALSAAARFAPAAWRGFKAARTYKPWAQNLGIMGRAKDILMPRGGISAPMAPRGAGAGFRTGSFLRQNPIFTASLLPQTVAGAYGLGKGTLKSLPGAAKSYVEAVLPGDQSGWWKETEVIEKPEEPEKKSTVKKLTEAEKKLIADTKKKNAKLAKDERVNELLEMMGYDKAKKTAAYDALIDAGQTIIQRGTLDKENIGRELIDPIVERTSKRFDKPEQIKEAVGLMQVKGEIEKDIAKGKGGQLQQNARDLVAGGVFPDMASALNHLAKRPSLAEKAVSFAQGMKKGGIDQEVVIRTIQDDVGEMPKVLMSETEMEKAQKEDTYTSDLATFTAIVKAQDLDPGYYVIGRSGFVVDNAGKIKQVL